MLQRNVQPYPLTVPSLSLDVEPGDVVDHPDLITGFEPVDHGSAAPKGQPSAEPEPEADAKAKPAEAKKTTNKADASPASTKEA